MFVARIVFYVKFWGGGIKRRAWIRTLSGGLLCNRMHNRVTKDHDTSEPGCFRARRVPEGPRCSFSISTAIGESSHAKNIFEHGPGFFTSPIKRKYIWWFPPRSNFPTLPDLAPRSPRAAPCAFIKTRFWGRPLFISRRRPLVMFLFNGLIFSWRGALARIYALTALFNKHGKWLSAWKGERAEAVLTGRKALSAPSIFSLYVLYCTWLRLTYFLAREIIKLFAVALTKLSWLFGFGASTDEESKLRHSRLRGIHQSYY